MRILIINLTRLGDLVQTMPLVNGLRAKYPDAEIDFLAMKAFAGILKRFSGLHEVIELDDTILVESIHERPWDAYAHLDSVLKQLGERRYDLLVNPVVSIQTSLLAYLIPAAQKRGMIMTSERRQTIAGEWTAFHLANEHQLGDRTFNLVDIFSHTGGISAREELYRFEPVPGLTHKAKETYSVLSDAHLPLVGFHIGASRSNKAWDPVRFREVIVQTLNHARVVLFGGYRELPLNNLFAGLNHPRFRNLVGMFGLDELIAHIGLVDLFVTNDTGPMHLAAATNRPILNLSLGPVSLWETGPYRAGSYILQADVDCHPCRFDHECGDLACHTAITPEKVTEIIAALIAGTTPSAGSGTRLWRTNTDIYGLAHALPAQRRTITPREWFFECKRGVWGMSLTDGIDPTRDWAQVYLDYLKTGYDIPALDVSAWVLALEDQQKRIDDLVQALERLAGMGNHKTIDRIRSAWAEIKTKKAELIARARDFSLDFDFFYFAEFKESHLQGNGLHELAKQTAGIYRTTGLQIAVLVRMLRSAQ